MATPYPLWTHVRRSQTLGELAFLEHADQEGSKKMLKMKDVLNMLLKTKDNRIYPGQKFAYFDKGAEIL